MSTDVNNLQISLTYKSVIWILTAAPHPMVQSLALDEAAIISTALEGILYGE